MKHIGSLADQQRERVEALEALRVMRRQARAEIDRLITFLDASSIDPDLEDDGCGEDEPDGEPSLGSFDRMMDQSKSWNQVHGEAIAKTDAELDDSDAEPSLGRVEASICETAYLGVVNFDQNAPQGGASDREGDEHDGREPDDSGIADIDGLMEQCPTVYRFNGQRVE